VQNPLIGLFETEVERKPRIVEYEPDPDLRDTEQIPLLEEGGIEAFFRREVLPHVPDAWIDGERKQIMADRAKYKRTVPEITASAGSVTTPVSVADSNCAATGNAHRAI